MLDICRLCLSIVCDNKNEFREIHEVSNKIQTCFSLDILLTDILPNKVCIQCSEAIQCCFDFYNKILANDKNLKHHAALGEDNLKDFLTGLKKHENSHIELENIKIKMENHDEFDVNDHLDSEEVFSNNKAKEDYSYTAAEKNHTILELEFKCLICLELFEASNTLLKHYKKVHSAAKDENYMNRYSTRNINGKVIYKCKECKKEFPSKSRINQHVVKHSKDRPFICKICGRTYKSAMEILNHGKAHGGKKMNCSLNCGFSTVYAGALKTHELRHHTDFKYVCKECNKGFFEKTTYDQHQNIHSGVKPYVCDECGMAFHVERYLKRHKTKHPQPTSQLKKHVCLQCLQPFDAKTYLQEHMWLVHQIKQSHLCDTCGKSFRMSKLLKDHMRTHDESIERYKCSLCDKTFKKKCNLSRHEEVHAGLLHECPLCRKKFSQKSSLSRHLKGRCKSKICTETEMKS